MTKSIADLFVIYKNGLVPEIKEEEEYTPLFNNNRYDNYRDLLSALGSRKIDTSVGEQTFEEQTNEVFEESSEKNKTKKGIKYQYVSSAPSMIQYTEDVSLPSQELANLGLTQYVLDIQRNNSKNYTNFSKHLKQYMEENPDFGGGNILSAIAALESNYNQTAQNKGSTAKGWFQFLDSTESQFSNIRGQSFLNDPMSQIRAAAELYNTNLNNLRKYETEIRSSNLTPLQIMYGMWWRPKSLINYLKTGSDSYVAPDGMTLYKIFKKAE